MKMIVYGIVMLSKMDKYCLRYKEAILINILYIFKCISEYQTGLKAIFRWDSIMVFFQLYLDERKT